MHHKEVSKLCGTLAQSMQSFFHTSYEREHGNLPPSRDLPSMPWNISKMQANFRLPSRECWWDSFGCTKQFQTSVHSLRTPSREDERSRESQRFEKPGKTLICNYSCLGLSFFHLNCTNLQLSKNNSSALNFRSDGYEFCLDIGESFKRREYVSTDCVPRESRL